MSAPLGTMRWVTYNILEHGTVAVTSANTLYPARRLYDRDFASPFLTNDTLPLTVTIDQDALIRPVDFLAITRHNLAHIDVRVECSVTGDTYMLVDQFTPTSSATWVVRTFETSTYPSARYWRVQTVNPTIVQRMGELFLGARQAVEAYVQQESQITVDPNAIVVKTPAGHRYASRRGAALSTYRREIAVLPTSVATWGNADAVEAMLEDVHHGVRPFWVYDERDRLHVMAFARGYVKVPVVPGCVFGLNVELEDIAV